MIQLAINLSFKFGLHLLKYVKGFTPDSYLCRGLKANESEVIFIAYQP